MPNRVPQHTGHSPLGKHCQWTSMNPKPKILYIKTSTKIILTFMLLTATTAVQPLKAADDAEQAYAKTSKILQTGFDSFDQAEKSFAKKDYQSAKEQYLAAIATF